MAALVPGVVDVPLSTMDQTPPPHGGAIGRVQVLLDAEVVKYVPPTAGGTGGSTPQTVSVQQREAFVSLPSETRDSTTGNTGGFGFPPAELLSALGDQLLSIADAVPKVWNGSAWTEYLTARVLTGKLSQDILHTSNKTIQACDSAVIGAVTCFVWTETNEGLTTSYVGFRATEGGAWIVTPRPLYASASAASIAMAKVVSNGTLFWVFCDDASANLQIQAYNTHGELLAAAVKTRRWTTSPGFWDVIVTPNATVVLAQPASYNPEVDVHVEFTAFAIAAGPTIFQSSHTDTSIHCQGPVAWLTNSQGFSAFSYLATIAPGGEGSLAVYAYEVNTGSLAQVHQYLVTNIGTGQTIDSMTGYIRSGSGIGVVVALSLLSEYSPAAGPPNDPGLRNIRVYDCERDGTQVFIKQANGVVLQSRAFTVPGTPPSASDFFAVTYYQSGGGLLPEQQAETIEVFEGDFMIGEPLQDVHVNPGDFVSGSPYTLPISFVNNAGLFLTDSSGAITHNGGDSVTAFTPATGAVWDLLNASIRLSGAFSFLRIVGSAIPTNNQDYLILNVISSTRVVTEARGSSGNIVTSETLAGVTASLVPNVRLLVQQGDPPFGPIEDLIPHDMLIQFIGGTLTPTAMINPADEVPYTIIRYVVTVTGAAPPLAPVFANIICAPGSFSPTDDSTSATTVTLAPITPNEWVFGDELFDTSYIGDTLIVDGALDSNNGEFPITNALGDALLTEATATLLPQRFGSPVPVVKVRLADASTAMTISFTGFTFDQSYRGAFLTISGATHPENNGIYEITQVISAHVVQVVSTTGSTGQVNEVFPFADLVATVTRVNNNSPSYQPCWFLTPLSITQQAAGRFEYGVAYADWRFDGATLGDTDLGAEFTRDNFPFALSSVCFPDLVDALVVLPYRAQSFTAGQVVRSGPNIVGIASVQESTVGLKQFRLAGADFGQAVVNSGEMLLPGPMGAAFSASGFHEDSVNVGPEQPFLVSQSQDSTPGVIGLSRNVPYQYVVVFEIMDENGDRTFSIPSPALDVTLTGDNNVATIGGRMPGPTNRPLVGLGIYRIATASGVPTIQHYKITNDLDVNGIGFTFSNLNGGPVADTWQFVDSNADAAILSQEILYTDKGLTPRYPVPAFSQGVGSWCNRPWVIGYDGAVWMGGEKTEGDAVWFTPIFRFVLPTDDKPVALAALDEYLLVFCSRSIWYIPKADFPAANLQAGSLPTPIQLPFQNGCTGWATTIRAGVSYASTAGGVWLITRQLTNAWLSQAIQDELASATVTALAIDQKQRLFVMVGTARVYMFDQVSNCWSIWRLPGAAALGAAWRGQLAYQDLAEPGHVAVHTPGVFADSIGGALTAIAPDITLAGVSLAGVRSYKRVWAIQLVGTYKGPHRLNAVISYPDEDQDPTTYGPFTPDPDEAYVFEINPDPEEASTFGLRVFVDFVGVETPGNSFTFELVSFEVGLEQGINRRPSSKRIPSSG